MPTPRQDETREQMNERRRWQASKRVVNQTTGQETTTYTPARAEYKALDGGQLARRSTLVDAEGNVIQQWNIEKPEAAAQKAALDATLAAFREDGPRAPVIDCFQPYHSDDDLLVGYPIGDHHIGMLSWWRETGGSYDLDIAEKLLSAAVDHLVEKSDNGKHAIVATLGDFLHYDSMQAVTPKHGHILDQDSRAAKMVSAAARAMIHTIERVAEKHEFVHVMIEFGNHDPFSTLWLMQLVRMRYEANPRITVDTSPGGFHYHRFGQNLIATHHGDTVKKLADLPLIMAADRPEDWGETTHRVWWTGHKHSELREAFNGCIVEQFPVLPPPDAYSHMLGYHKVERRMQSIVFHKEMGEVARYSFRPEMMAK